MLRIFASCERKVLGNFRVVSYRRFSTADSDERPSYIHRLGSTPLKFVNIGQQLKEIATKYPDRQSLVSYSENSRLTFAETLDKVDKLASGLLNLGLSRGDRVAIWAPNYEFWYISKLAICRAGLICVALNPAYQLAELDYSLKKVDVKAIIIPETFRTQKYYEMLATLIPSLAHSKHLQIEDNHVNSLRKVIVFSDNKLPGAIQYSDLLRSASESDAAEIEKLQTKISPDSGCNIQFTSGTTGQPKAALVSHFSLVNSGNNTGTRVELDRNYRRICSNLPFFHIAGVASITNAMAHGSTLVIPAPHFSADHALEAIVKEKCDAIYGIPSMYVDMIAKQRKNKYDLSEISLSIIGAAICTPKLVKDSKKYLNINKFTSQYGMTETSAAGFQSLADEHQDLVEDYVGQVADHIEAKVIDRDGHTVPFGQPGELCLRGYCNMLGYWGDEKKTKEVLDADKWLRTGDQFILYPNGYAKIVGRLKEMIIRGGENLFPREIEDFLNTHPNIQEAHVIGIPDERMGEEVAAFIKLKDPSKELTRDEIKEFCKGKLSHFKIPRYIVLVDKFPRTSSGKVQKIKFLEYFADEIKVFD